MTDCTVERAPHDKEHPYLIVSRDLIRDKSLSPNCRWLIIFLLSHADGWVIKTSYIASQTKDYRGFGRNNIEKMLNEAIAAGYMKRESFSEGNLTRYKYFVSERKRYSKNVSDAPILGAPDFGGPGTGALKKEQSFPSGKEKNKQIKNPPLPPPSNMEDLKKKMISLGWSIEEFQEAWNRLLKSPKGSVKHIEAWILKTMSSIRLEQEKGKALDAIDDSKAEEKKKSEDRFAEYERMEKQQILDRIANNTALVARYATLDGVKYKKRKGGVSFIGHEFGDFIFGYEDQEFEKIFINNIQEEK